MNGRLLIALLLAAAAMAEESSAQWWVGGHSYSWRVDKYDSFYGEARPILWSVQRPPGVHWKEMLPSPREMHARLSAASSGYKAVYHAGYPQTFHSGVPGGAVGYPMGYPVGYPVGMISEQAQRETARPPVVQIEPLPEEEYSIVEPVEEVWLPPPGSMPAEAEEDL